MVDTVRTLADLQTLLADNTNGDISAQDLRDFLVSTAIGGEAAYLDHRLPGETAHTDDLFFKGSDLAAGTVVTPTGGSPTYDQSESMGKLSLRLADGDTVNDLYGVAWSLTPSSSPVTIETRVTLTPGSLTTQAYGFSVGFADGNTASDNVAGFLLRKESTGLETWDVAGTYDSATLGSGLNQHYTQGDVGLYVRVGWTAANTFVCNFSYDGVLYTAGTFSSHSRTITPTHFYVAVAMNQVEPGMAAFDYIRVYESDETV